MQERGFSLIELLVVIAIILVISAIAIPSLLHSKIAANEASAVYSIRTINTAQVTYATTYPTVGYAATLNMLASPATGAFSSTTRECWTGCWDAPPQSAPRADTTSSFTT